MESLYIFEINDSFDNNNKKIACFDYDWTLVKPKTGNEFPKDENDYEWLYPSVPIVLEKFHNSGYSIYIFTNQTKLWKLDMIKNSTSHFSFPIKVIVGNKEYKKPNKELFDIGTNRISFDENSFYVGDAAGRPNDWSDVDKMFAANIGIDFKIPEDVFEMDLTRKLDTNEYHKDYQEIIILVGYMASGKTTFANNKLKPFGYEIINGDLLKTVPKILKESKLQLQDEKSIVIDATNGTKKKRLEYIKLASDFNIPVRCFVFTMDMDNAMKWNTWRQNETGKKVPKIAFYTYRKHYETPESDECPLVFIN